MDELGFHSSPAYLLQTYRMKLAPYVVDAIPFMASAQEQPNTSILVEGANAIMLDVDYGTFPFVTSSSTGIGGVFTGRNTRVNGPGTVPFY